MATDSSEHIPLIPGAALDELVREPTQVQLFAFSAATWNSHRIHFDREYARETEGYPDVLVQSHLHACFLGQAVRAAFGQQARFARLGWQNLGVAVPGDLLTVTGRIEAVHSEAGMIEVGLALEERNQRGEICVKGWATVALREEGGGS
jgi:hydroxyacyl-ACP dehydratase HTD2-like protein with hotdog domain